MVKHRIREWLLDHPNALWFVFLLASKGSEHIPEITTKSGGSAFKGP